MISFFFLPLLLVLYVNIFIFAVQTIKEINQKLKLINLLLTWKLLEMPLIYDELKKLAHVPK